MDSIIFMDNVLPHPSNFFKIYFLSYISDNKMIQFVIVKK